MARIDDYNNAREIAVEKLSSIPFEEIADNTGFKKINSKTFSVPFLNRQYLVSHPDFIFSDNKTENCEVPIQEQVFLLHYCLSDKCKHEEPEWISFRELKGASFYFGAFINRAVTPLKQVFGSRLEALHIAAEKLNGVPIEAGDAGYRFNLLPNVPIKIILWKGDEDFSPEANILFNDNIGKILDPEDIAWLAGNLVYRLIALAKN